MRLAIIENGTVVNILRCTAGMIPPEFEGAPVAAEDTRIGDAWDGRSFMPAPPPAVTSEQVNAERERRLDAGTVISVAGYGDIPVEGRLKDQIAYLGVLSAARDAASGGGQPANLKFRDRDNVMHSLTPAQMVALMTAARSYAQRIYEASWILKDQTPIPQDYQSDTYWEI